MPAHLVAEVLAHLGDDLVGQLGPGVVHHQDDRADLERRVEVLLDQLDVAQQLAQALEGVVLALDRDQHLVGRGQRVHGEQAERRRAVDEDVVVVVAHRRRGPCCSRSSRLNAGTSSISAPARSRLAGATKRLRTAVASMQSSMRHVVQEDVVHRGLEVADVDAQAGAGVALRIEVDDQDPVAEVGQAGAEVDRGGGLADAALLVGDGDDPGQWPGEAAARTAPGPPVVLALTRGIVVRAVTTAASSPSAPSRRRRPAEVVEGIGTGQRR